MVIIYIVMARNKIIERLFLFDKVPVAITICILKCVDCGAELALDDSFCSACGKPIEEPEIRGTLARKTSFPEDSSESIEPPTESAPAVPEQIKEAKPKTTKDSKRDFVILGLTLGIILIVVIIVIVSQFGERYPNEDEGNAYRAMAECLSMSGVATVWLNELGDEKPSEGEWGQFLNNLDGAVRCAKSLSSAESLNALHPQLAGKWTTLYIPSMETSIDTTGTRFIILTR